MNLASDRRNPPHLQLASTQRERTRSRQQGPSGIEEQTDPRCWPTLRVLASLIACYGVWQGCADWSREWSVVRAGKAPQVSLKASGFRTKIWPARCGCGPATLFVDCTTSALRTLEVACGCLRCRSILSASTPCRLFKPKALSTRRELCSTCVWACGLSVFSLRYSSVFVFRQRCYQI